jgi:guanosine-3',5'-bis(diphosphate) 3'-pyrophosphohydrolase
MLDKARSFAIAAHGDQKYGEQPYAYHLDAVVALLAPFGEQAQIVGYLHDVVEDTEVSEALVQASFGEHVASCVSLLTDEPGVNRKERKAKTYAKLAQVSGPTELALVVKAADRLANVRACVNDRKRSLWEIYRSEHPTFKHAAYRAGLCEPLWSELDLLLSESAFDAKV